MVCGQIGMGSSSMLAAGLGLLALLGSAQAGAGLSGCATLEETCLDTTSAHTIESYKSIGDPNACCTLCTASKNCSAWVLGEDDTCTVLDAFTARSSGNCTAGYLQGTATHYGNPFNGSCLPNEANYSVPDVNGRFCAAPCNPFLPTGPHCPADVPYGVTAKPDCVLIDPIGNGNGRHCALVCSADAECGVTATCAKPYGAGSIGICRYEEPIASWTRYELVMGDQYTPDTNSFDSSSCEGISTMPRTTCEYAGILLAPAKSMAGQITSEVLIGSNKSLGPGDGPPGGPEYRIGVCRCTTTSR